MAVKVKIPTPLRNLTQNQDTVEAESGALSSVVETLESQFPGMRERLLDEGGEIRRFVNIYVNGEDVRFLSGLTTDLKDGDEVVGNETRVKVVKNKVSPPFKQAEFQIMYGKGIYHMGEVIDWGVKLNLVDKSGAWYAYKGDKIAQGKANAAKFLEDNPAVANEIETQIRAQMLTPVEQPKAKTAAPEEAAEQE